MHLRNLIWIALWVCFSTVSLAQSITDFDKANENYKNGNYAEAAVIYEEILKSGLQSTEVYFNLGNTYYKLDKLGPSIHYYEKGLQLDPTNKDIINNLHYAKQATVDQINAPEKDKLQQISNSIVRAISTNTWAILAIISALLSAGLFILYYFTRKPSLKRVWFITSLVFLLGVIGSISMAYANLKIKDAQYAIIWAKQVEVLDGPTKNSNHIYYLHEGTKVLITYEEDNWLRILLEDGNEGWLQIEGIKKL